MSKATKSNWQYIVWFLFYFLLFSLLTFGVAIPIYLVTVPLAFSSSAEKMWRRISGIRPLRLRREMERLVPLFKEVYTGAFRTDPTLSRHIKLYIKEDMSINAFAFGKSSMIITRGSLELLSDDCLKGLMAHEFGHFAHGDTIASLFATVSNLFLSLAVKTTTDLKARYERNENGGLLHGALKGLCDFVYYIFRGFQFLGDVILMRHSRKQEYMADDFAERAGFGKELTEVLLEIYGVAIERPQSVKEQLRSTHPHITLRIAQLERGSYSK